MSQENTIHVEPFAIDSFTDAVVAASGGKKSNAQVRYLARYLDRLGARTVVRETRYVDRHYMDEYALFYSRMLHAPTNTVVRMHFFAKRFDDAALRRWMMDGFRGGKGIADKIASEAGTYFGFTCIRPIVDSPIGRTVISRWPDDTKTRDIWAVGTYGVHIGNLPFEVTGLPFQQQEAAVGACATVALWSALSRVARHERMRAPTPAEITEAVERPIQPHVRAPLAPTTGFTADQICAATQLFGFTPVTITGDRPEVLALALHTYLQSGIPVVVVLRGSGRGHAVTALGFQLSGSERGDLESLVPTRSQQLHKIYVHDDRLGPYARATLTPFRVSNVESMPDMEGMRFDIADEKGEAEHWIVEMLVAAVYPKVRLSIASLVGVAAAIQPVVEEAVGQDAFDLRADFRYDRAGDYLASLTRVVAPAQGAELATRVAMSRWCAIVRWSLRDEQLIELVFDTTDILRGDCDGQLVAVVARAPGARAAARTLADRYGVPAA